MVPCAAASESGLFQPSRELAMPTTHQEVIDLETKFWQSLVDEDTDTALSMLDEPALMVSPHGAMQFDHEQYRQMAEQGSMVVKSYELSDMQVVFPTESTAVLTYRVKQALSERGKSKQIEQEMADSSVWTKKDGQWLCVMHTETPMDGTQH
jgi:ketosteroid isomerase-like protein